MNRSNPGSPSRVQSAAYNEENPFSLPREDIFMMREREKAAKKAEKERQATLKIWEKGNPHARGYSTRDRLRIPRARRGQTAAKQDMYPGHRHEKENMAQFISKKREMFLTQMSLDTKREEIQILEEKAAMKEDALKKSEQLLEEDAHRFGDFLRENDQKAHDALKQADIETKDKQEKQQEIKKLLAEIGKYENEIQKKDDTLKRCREYKEFLDNLSPPEWRATQAQKRAARKQEKQLAMISAGLDPDDEASSSEEEMYFKHPDELLDKFSQLEGRCLQFIEQVQQSDEFLEELKSKQSATKTSMSHKTIALEANIRELELKIQEEHSKVGKLQSKSYSGEEGEKNLLAELTKKTLIVYHRCDFPESQDPLVMLRDLEGWLEHLLSKMDIYANTQEGLERLQGFAEQKKKDRRAARVANLLKEVKVKEAEDLAKSTARAKTEVIRRTGKAVMFRSAPTRKKKKKEVRVETDSEVEELRKFFS